MALALGVAGLRNLGAYANAHEWGRPAGRNLLDGRATILGGGGITESLVRLLQPWNCRITVVRSNVQAMDGVDDVLEADRFADALPGADLVVLALALTPETEGMFSRGEFTLMEPHAWIVNVARGRHIVTDDLVDAPVPGRSAVPASTSPTPNRCRPGIRCGRFPTASSRRTSATRPRWRNRCWLAVWSRTSGDSLAARS